MKTIKIYLNEDGSFRNGLTPDFILNQYSWQDTLINVYVPTSIIDLETGSTGVVAMFRSYDSEGKIVEEISSNKYNFAFVRRNVYRPNDPTEYALFERIMPKQMTLYAGEQVLIINTVVYNLNNEITNIITSGEQTYNVVASGIAEESEEESDLSTIQAEINTLKEKDLELREDKQDRVSENIDVFTDSQHSNKTHSVEIGLNAINTRLANSEVQVDINTQDIERIKGTIATGEKPIAHIEMTTPPNSNGLTIFVISQMGRQPTENDVIYYTQVTDNGKINYKCMYSVQDAWFWYEIPSTELATQTTYGTIRGTTNDTHMYVTLTSGEITKIEIFDDNVSGLVDIKNAITDNHFNIIKYLTGNNPTAVPKAKADENGNDIAQTYLKKTDGVSKQYVDDYALPKLFNDVNYFNFNTQEMGKELVDNSYESTINTIGSHSIRKVYYIPHLYKFDLSQNNRLGGNIQFYTNVDSNDFTITLNVTLVDTSATRTLLATYTSNEMSVVAGAINNLKYDMNCQLLEDKVVNVDETSSIEFEVVVSTTESKTVKFTFISNTTYPSTNQFAVSFGTVTFAKGVIGEEEKHTISTYTRGNDIVTFDIGDNIILIPNTKHYFELKYDNVVEDTDQIRLMANNVPITIVTKNNVYTRNATLSDLEGMKCYDNNTNLYTLRFNGFYQEENNIPYFMIDDTRIAKINQIEEEVNERLAQQDEAIQGLGNLEPSGVDTSTNILAFNEDKGIYVGSDTGHWYYWNGTQYADGGVYQATEIAEHSVTPAKTTFLQNEELENKFNYPNISETTSKGITYSLVDNNRIKLMGTATEFFELTFRLENTLEVGKTYSFNTFTREPANEKHMTRFAYGPNSYIDDYSTNKTFVAELTTLQVSTYVWAGETVDLEIPIVVVEGKEIPNYYYNKEVYKPISNAAYKSLIVVAQDGTGDYLTIQDAINNAHDTPNSPVTIYLKNGVYNEVISIREKRNLSFVGANRDKCIWINKTGKYPNAPLYIAGDFYIENITFKMTIEDANGWVPTFDIADHDNTFPGYALHIDWYSKDPNIITTGRCFNCKFYSQAYPAVGLGVHKNQYIIFDNCEFEREIIDNAYIDAYEGAIVAHCSQETFETNQNLVLKNCVFLTNTGKAAYLLCNLAAAEYFTLYAINNTFYSKTEGNDIVYLKGASILSPASHGNNITTLNSE